MGYGCGSKRGVKTAVFAALARHNAPSQVAEVVHQEFGI
jgi:hypothetical protein